MSKTPGEPTLEKLMWRLSFIMYFCFGVAFASLALAVWGLANGQ